MIPKTATRLDNINSYQYCPYCGEKLESREYPVRWTQTGDGHEPTKYNTEIHCSNHGVLYE